MPHTYTSLLVHCVFSTKGRSQSISLDWRNDLWAYMGGIARTHRMKALAIGGTRDHVHMLLSIAATMPVAKAVQLIKAGSSKWVHERTGRKLFAWQEAYGAFTIGVSQVADTVRYINTQDAHHSKRPFEEEFRQFLRRHEIPFEEEHAFG
ncbi:MAG: IS200/IS605 family transposase [Acidobacteria bacterium]|nr:IS200/IS605 family transposase [Acidobacteriota bacterium]